MIWIAVSERLPDGEQLVLTQLVEMDHKTSGLLVTVWREPEHGRRGVFDSPRGWYEVGEVTHWMPVTEPSP